MFKLKSSNDWDHSHQTPIRCLHLNNCKVYNITQFGDIAPFRISYLILCCPVCQQHHIYPTQFQHRAIYQHLGSDTIIALTSPFLQAFVMLSNIGIFFLIRSTVSASDSSFFCSGALSRSLFSDSKLILICFFVAPGKDSMSSILTVIKPPSLWDGLICFY